MYLTAISLYYYTNFKPFGPHNLFFLPTEGEPTLYVLTDVEAIRAQQESWVKDVRTMKDVPGTIKSYVNSNRISSNEIGLGGAPLMEPALRNEVEKGLGFKLKEVDYLQRKVKRGEDEIQVAKRVAKIVDAELETILRVTKPGMTEYELSAELDYTAKMLGADDNFTYLSSGAHNYAMHASTDRRLQVGDIIIFELSPVVNRQRWQICRTVVLGKPSELLVQKFALLQKALDESLKVIKPGAMASEIAKTQNQIISAAGYGEYCKPPYMRARGHAFGVGETYPGNTIDERLNIPLEENMILVAHPNQYLPETGYLALGDPVLVTKTGYERETSRHTGLIVVQVD